MMDGKFLSKLIRDRKKKSLRPDMDDAGQEGLPPEQALSAELNAKVNEMTGEDHEPASEKEMGEDDSSQSKPALKKAMSRINRYMETMLK